MLFSAAFTAIFWLLGAAILGGLIVYFLMKSRYGVLWTQYTGLQADYALLKKNCEAKQIELNAEIERLKLQISPLQLSIDEKETQIVVFKRDYMLKSFCEDEQNAQRTLILNLQNQLSQPKNVDLSLYIEKGEYDNLKGKHFSLKNEFDALQGTYQTQINELNTEIDRLKAQINAETTLASVPILMASTPKQEIDLSLYVEKKQYEKVKRNHETLQAEHKLTISDRDIAFGKYNATIDELKKRITNVGNTPQVDMSSFVAKDIHQKVVANLRNELDLSLFAAREELAKTAKQKADLKNELDLGLFVAREELAKTAKQKADLKNELDLSLFVAREELARISKEKQAKDAENIALKADLGNKASEQKIDLNDFVAKTEHQKSLSNLKNELDLSLYVAREELAKISKEKQAKEAEILALKSDLGNKSVIDLNEFVAKSEHQKSLSNLKNELDLSLYVAREELAKISKEKQAKEAENLALKADLSNKPVIDLNEFIAKTEHQKSLSNLKNELDLSLYVAREELAKISKEKQAKEVEIMAFKANSERNAERNAAQNVDLSVYILKEDCKKLQEEKLAEINALKATLETTNVVSGAVVSNKKEKVSAEDKKEASLEKIRRRADSFDYSNMGVATSADKDDLKIIVGIGPFIEEKLNALGIYLFSQISKFNDNDVEQVTKAIEFFPGRITRDDWIAQAVELHRKKVAGEPLE